MDLSERPPLNYISLRLVFHIHCLKMVQALCPIYMRVLNECRCQSTSFIYFFFYLLWKTSCDGCTNIKSESDCKNTTGI